ncbi:hypothetical protein [Eubacterium oxidoreducens]|uniref:Uncharacterized protein n=1 Tax=Eubacterium oxidoreducens TaxID=1732 RepID=A0A1G6B2D2_EUBOX|nr:hypothetical protein [Eubacterium oxidoreducens]SDB14830.1 hypothetical protein SAMN02910417_01083 [Eubacterium oxidoreducens]
MKVVATVRGDQVRMDSLSDFAKSFCKKEGFGKISSLVLFHNLNNHQPFSILEEKRIIAVGRNKGISFDYQSNGKYLVKTKHGGFTIFVQEV